MAVDIRTLILRLQNDVYNRGLKKSQRATRALGGASTDLTGILKGLGAAFAAREVFQFSKNAIKAAADAEETANKFTTVFESISAGAEKAAQEYAQSFDVASSTAKKLLSDTGDLLVGFGFSEAAALDLSSQVNALAADLASFTNFEGGAARASAALTKALVGETEQAKALGIVIRQGTKEYKERVRVLMETQNITILQAKALANLQIAAEQSQKALGDYARTSESTSNLMKANAESAKEFTEAFGGALKAILPIDLALKKSRDAMAGLAIPLQDIANILGDIEKLDPNSPLALLLPDLSARDAGADAARKSAEIFGNRQKQRQAADNAAKKSLDARKARTAETLRLLAIVGKAEEKRAQREKELNDKQAKARAAERRRIEPLQELRDQLRLQRLVNQGREREAFIQRQLLSVSKDRLFSEKELSEVARLSGEIFDAMQSKAPEGGPSRGLRLAGAALEGSAEAARSIAGAGATVDEQIEDNTKATAKHTADIKKGIDTMIRTRPQPANLGRRR